MSRTAPREQFLSSQEHTALYSHCSLGTSLGIKGSAKQPVYLPWLLQIGFGAMCLLCSQLMP